VKEWPSTWPIVADASEDFGRAFERWAASQSFDDLEPLYDAHYRLLDRWREAVRQYELYRIGQRSGPVKIIERDGVGRGFSLPAEQVASGVRLDLALVESIRAETRASASLLEPVFDREEAPTPQDRPIAGEGGGGLLGLDEPHATLAAKLIGQPRWPTSEVRRLAKDLGLLGSGAMEAINEASFELCGEPLLDGPDPIEINPFALEAMEAT